MRSHVGWGGERNILYKSVKTSPIQMRFKTMRLTTICNELKRTISSSVELGLLQMASKPDTEWYASEDAGPPRGINMISHINWRGERNIPYKGVETSPLTDAF